MMKMQAERMANFCVTFGQTPEIYRSLKAVEFAAFWKVVEHGSED
jgi:hypothetical protein